MRTLLIPSLVALGLSAQAPTSAVTAFRFDAAKVPVGRVLRYTKSNRDGSHAIDVVVRVNSVTDVEVVKIENHGRYLAHIKSEMDWDHFTVGHARSWNRLESGEPNLQAELQLDAAKHLYNSSFNGALAPAKVGHYPLVVYNFDFIGANLIWPFLKDPKGGVDLGVADPDFEYMATKIKGPGFHPDAFPYRGKVTFRYVGEADHKGVPCLKYAVGGPAFGGAEGTLLVNKAEGYWECFEHPKADNPAWKDFKFELQRAETMSAAQWKATFDGIVAKAQGPEDLDPTPVTGMTMPQMLREGIAAAEGQEWVPAIRLLGAFTAANPLVGEAWANLGDAYYEAKHYLRAAEAYRKASDLGFNAANTRYWGAGCLAKAGKTEEALEALRAALALGYENRPGALEDRDFKAMRGDRRFLDLVGVKPEGSFDRTARWTHDVQWTVKELKRKHVHLNAKLDPAKLDAEAARLQKDLPSLTDAQITVRLMQLMALVGDGHTAMLPPVAEQFPYSMGMPLPELKLASLPLRFFLFPEGPRVVATTVEQQRLLGARLVKVNGVAVDQALERLTTTISRENPMWVKEQMPNRLQVPAILQALGLAPSESQAVFTFEVAGREETVTVPALAAGAKPEWKEAAAPSLKRNKERPYWEEYLPAANTMVVRYNLCRAGQEAPEAFWGRVIKEAESKKAARFVIDLSANSGGNNALNKPMVEGLRRSEWLNQPGRLYVITGRATFSAAMNAAADLARETKATFVGEPTGSAPSFAGEASALLLPFSGLRGMISSRYFQGAEPTDRSMWIAPSLLVEPNFEAWKAGKDAALEVILAQPAK